MEDKKKLKVFLQDYIQWSKQVTTPTTEDLDKMEKEYTEKLAQLKKQDV